MWGNGVQEQRLFLRPLLIALLLRMGLPLPGMSSSVMRFLSMFDVRGMVICGYFIISNCCFHHVALKRK